MKIRTLLTLLILFSLSIVGHSQAWSGILNSSRAVDWSGAGLPATLPDGETTTNPWTPPVRTLCTTLSSSATISAINTALQGCPTGTYVQLAGTNSSPVTYNFNSGSACFANSGNCIQLYNTNGVTLRGGGAQATIVNLDGFAAFQFGVTWNTTSQVVTSGLSQGSTSVVIPSTTGSAGNLVIGELATFNQCDTGYSGTPCTGTPVDNGGLYICGDNNPCQVDSDTGNNNHQYQVVRVTNIAGNTVTFTPALYMPNWSTANTATLSWSSSTNAGGTAEPYGNGLEDMTIHTAPTSGASAPVDMSRTYASWTKGIRFIGSGTDTDLSISGSHHVLAFNNYFFADIALDGATPTPVQELFTCNNLLLNNLMTSGVPWEGLGGNCANVNAYNYGRDAFTGFYDNTPFDHHAGSSFALHEGEETGAMLVGDNTWGTHNLDTYFRNYVSAWDNPYVIGPGNDLRGMQLQNFQRFMNMIGNVIGPGAAFAPLNVYQVSSTATQQTVFSFGSTDTLTLTSSMRWGNCDSVTNTCRFQSSEVPTSLSGNAAPFVNSVPASHALPASFFLPTTAHPSGGTGLSWWKVCKTWTTFPTNCATSQIQPFQPTGPDVTGGTYVNGTSYDIPAQLAWASLPIDPAYQNSYSITGSSWSSGTETLTVSGLPNTTHLMGGFQVSGGACAGGEFLITGSTSTTVSYALGSNPGSCSGGTMKVPDVRKFDEAVYQNDPAGATFTWTATIVGSGSLTGTNAASGTYASGTTIGPLTPVPGTGYSFSAWSAVSGSAACSGSTVPCPSFSLTVNSAATATFTINSYNLTASTSGTGTGTNTGCGGAHNFGASYSCTATAGVGSVFNSWSSNCGGTPSGTTYSGTMPANNCAVTAIFSNLTTAPSPPTGLTGVVIQ